MSDVDGAVAHRWDTPDDPARTMLDVWLATALRCADQPAVIFGDRTISFAEIDRLSDVLAVGLQAQGMAVGDSLGVYLQNDPQWVVALVAAWKIGAVTVAINPMYRERELEHILEDSRAKVLICLNELVDVVEQVRDRTCLRRVITTHPGDISPSLGDDAISDDRAERRRRADHLAWTDLLALYEGHTPAPFVASPEHVAVLTYTSGTTGASKGAMNLHRNMVHSAWVYSSWFDLDDSDVVLGMAPLFHITGMVAGVAVMMHSGVPLVLLHRFSALAALSAIARTKATFAVGTSTAFIAMIDAHDGQGDLSSFRKVASGGAPLSPALVARAQDELGLNISGVYGLTETTSPTHLTPREANPPIDPTSGALAVGVPVPGAEVRIVGDNGAETPTGEPGEILLRGPMVVPGYWNLPDETARTIDENGWFRSGDIGFVDVSGWLFVVDRKKDLINAGGYKVWPREVEDTLYEHPAVSEAAVIGIPDEYRGETVKAFVSLRPGSAVDAAALVDHCRSRLAAYKYPRHIDILDELPKNAAGKILRRELRHAEP
ncbi:AMP-binding protein [Rhodococcus sp. NCIMB 12038]|uniref:AMP-binding protein n=1 Tax=Rhodococcus sp. NCIMB 12038 TaxID=933800 RepID=UPI000B3C413A|nr:AMP-binding protein [Rhodococcus sp. NCIMB 12038]OUS94279.1 hypothetical protein CA951_17865 [Rhodococcus sp. NCIMB 12038]